MGLETFHAAPKLALGFRFELKNQIAVHVVVQHFGMDVAFAADRRRVAEPRRDLLDSSSKIALGLGGAVKTFKFIESYCR